MKETVEKRQEDNWKHKHETMTCRFCMYHVNTRCRRNAPTMKGYPSVFSSDWCGEHKLDKDTIIGIEALRKSGDLK